MKGLNLPKEKSFTGAALIWKRIAAFLIDVLVLNFTVLLPFHSLLAGIIPKEGSFKDMYRFIESSTDYAGYITTVSIVISVFMMLYFILLERKTGQTIGKKLMKVYVVSDDDKLTAWKLFLRNIVFIPVFPFVLLWIIDPLFMFFTKTNQRLSEILSRTRVVEEYSL